jgi:hypothetical protein
VTLLGILIALGLAPPARPPARTQREVVARLVARHRPALGACIERQRHVDPDFREGHVEVHVLVDLSGRVADSFTVRSNVPAPLHDCVTRSITSWAFPAAAEDYEADIPLWLQAN